MANFYQYNPEQAYLLPPSVREVLGEGHLCFFVHRAVEKLNLEAFVGAYSEEGHPGVSPGADAEGVVVRIRGGDHQFAAAGGTHPGGFGAAVFGGGSGAGLLGAERFSPAAQAVGRNSRATGAAKKIGNEEVVAGRWGQPIFAAAARIRAGIRGDDRGE